MTISKLCLKPRASSAVCARAAHHDGGVTVGSFYVRSDDGVAWSLIPGSPSKTLGLCADGDRIYAAQSNTDGLIFEAPESDPTTWTEMPNHPHLDYLLACDRDHHLL